jgi:uncharacterized membrane protein YfcA
MSPLPITTLALAGVIGIAIGFLGGLFGKGGSAVATPLLHAIGVPALVAVAAPLPATVPSTAVAGAAYWRERLVDWRVVRWSIVFGVPATITGALLSAQVGGGALVSLTDALLLLIGVRFLLGRRTVSADVSTSLLAIAAVAIGVGVIAGLLANSGGFLLAPLFAAGLRMPIKPAFASSLAVATVLALPATIVHAALGHIDWTLVAVFAVTAVPLSWVGARVALRIDAGPLERLYGVVLVLLGAAFLIAG